MAKKKESPSYLNFDKLSYAWRDDINYSDQPEEYRVGKGEQGVLICEPYKSEIGPHWRFKTVNVAKESATKIFEIFNKHLNNNDFVGADMARKYLQMGFTRARRYANYKSGKKYNHDSNYEVNKKGTGDPEKAKSAEIFYAKWKEAEANEKYKGMKKDWKEKFG